jgi:hypothetical protein
MTAKLGSTDVSFRLGADEVAAVYLGTQEVWSAVEPTVPAAPTINYAEFYPISPPTTEVGVFPPSDGGSAITGYKLYFNGVEKTPDDSFDTGTFLGFIFNEELTGQSLEVSAVNAVGEGPKSEPFIVIEP